MNKTISRWRIAALSFSLLLLVLASSFYAVPTRTMRPLSFKIPPTSLSVESSSSDIAVAPIPIGDLQPIASTPSAVPAQIGDEYLALGDSVAYGLGAPLPNDLGYAGQFYNNYLKRLKPNLTYKDFGISGETTSSFISRPRGQSQLQRVYAELAAAKAAQKRISPITLTIGGNDMLNAINSAPSSKDIALKQFDTNLQTILSGLKAHTNGQSDIIITTYYNPFGGGSTGQADENTQWLERFNAVIEQRGKEFNIKVADFYPPINGQAQTLTWAAFGDVHPNQQGYSKLAQALWQASSYDIVPPTLSLAYSSLPTTNKVFAGQRFVFKLNAQDNWAIGKNIDVRQNVGAGSIWQASVILDDSHSQNLPGVPQQYVDGPIGSQQFTYILDTTELGMGNHQLQFSVWDAAGNKQNLNLNFEVAG